MFSSAASILSILFSISSILARISWSVVTISTPYISTKVSFIEAFDVYSSIFQYILQSFYSQRKTSLLADLNKIKVYFSGKWENKGGRKITC
jgi:hypothetical protein